ncbi:MAG: cation transporter [Nitrospirales bacterium]|nr:cation transporter [Nitrospirales bacterium]
MQGNGQRSVLFFTVVYFFVELMGGIKYHSLALVSDASFMAINIAGQLIALYVARLSEKSPTKTNTFGYERAKVLSGLFNGILVGFIIFYVCSDAWNKLMHPEPMEAGKVLLIAVIGLLVNAYGFIVLYKHSSDINIKGALLHIATDLLGSVGAIAAALIVMFTGLSFVDPLMGIVIGLLIAYPTWFLLRDSVHILMEGNPAHIDPDDVERFIYRNFPAVSNIKDLHIWGLSPERIILALRIRTDGVVYGRDGIKRMKRHLQKEFGFSDIYLELYEQKNGEQAGADTAAEPDLLSSVAVKAQR